jgi:hypothetical protein
MALGIQAATDSVHRSKGLLTERCVVSIFKTGLNLARGNALNLRTMKLIL